MDETIADPTDILEPALLIRVNQLYEPGMTDRQLYDCTRGVWVLGERRHLAKFAFAVYHGHIVDVFEIAEWHRAGTTEYQSREIDLTQYSNRWEFTGRLASEDIRARYAGRSVSHYFKQGEAIPVKYINC